MMEIHSLVLMDVILVHALLEMSLVPKTPVIQLLAKLTLIVLTNLDIVPKNHVMINKELALDSHKIVPISSN